MPDFAKMYRHLFNSQTDAITLLQKAQRATEEMYISAEPPDIRVLHSEELENSSDTDGNND